MKSAQPTLGLAECGIAYLSGALRFDSIQVLSHTSLEVAVPQQAVPHLTPDTTAEITIKLVIRP